MVLELQELSRGSYNPGSTTMAQTRLDLVTLAMFVVDEIYYPIPLMPATNILGGAGAYAVLGARIMRGSGRTIGWTVHKGFDFPEPIASEIQSWETMCNFVNTPERATTRGLNVYAQKERRGNIHSPPSLFRFYNHQKIYIRSES